MEVMNSNFMSKRRGGLEFRGIQFLIESMNLSMGIAAILTILMVPLAPSSIETLAMVSWFGASTIFTKS